MNANNTNSLVSSAAPVANVERVVMPGLTAAVLAVLLAYIAAWYSGIVQGNFSLMLLLVTFVCGLYWLAEKFYFWPRRRAAAQALVQAMQDRRAALAAQGIAQHDLPGEPDTQLLLRQPWWLDWTAGMFPVLLVIFVLRSFLFEPFKIPSGSMIPTLRIGDFILVNKFTYGLRLPVVNTKITQGNAPQRGDVVVFRYPPQPNLDYIKRVVGVPGDTVAYLDKRLMINGQLVQATAQPDFLDTDVMGYSRQWRETLGEHTHNFLTRDQAPAFVQGVSDFAYRDNCTYSIQGVTCTVPQGHYFVMGDNRDDSLDSRYWGFVPEENIVGKAFFVWMNLGDFSRIGRFD